jgi:YrbI family 3-deoxy-D-manno-octulosonate 8-phosphate phosphatase
MKLFMKRMLNKNSAISENAKKIRFFFSDVDGTLTDGSTYYSAKGEELKKFSHIDGTGFFLLKKLGIDAGFITGENSEIVKRRAEKLTLKYCFLGVQDKLAYMNHFAEKHGCLLENIAYIGDDMNDFLLINSVGISFATNNAHSLIKENCSICLSKDGGNGAFREAVELLMKLREDSVWAIFSKTN